MNKRFDDKQKGRLICAAFAVAAMILLVTVLAMPVKSEVVVEYSNGYTLILPDGWELEAKPAGFNSNPYDPKVNPAGKLPGWGGWPWYNLYLQTIGCGPDDGSPRFSPQPECPPQPELFKDTEQCHFDPPPELCVERDGGPYFSPHPPFCDEV